MIWLIKSIVIAFSLFSFVKICLLYKHADDAPIKFKNKLKLLFTGFIANISDTLGMGSFAVVTALDKYWKLIDDKKLPGTLNAHAILPTMVQSIIFLQIVEIDYLMLVTLVFGASIGGFCGGFVVAKLNKQTIRLSMCIGYLGIALLIFGNQMHWLPMGGEATTLEGAKLFIGFLAMILMGALPAVGVGQYAPTQAILFLMGMAPIVAFPIMTTAGAIQQPITSLAFILKKEIAVKKTLLLMGSGVVGVFVAAPLISYTNPVVLRWLLMAIVLFNVVMLGRSYLKAKKC